MTAETIPIQPASATAAVSALLQGAGFAACDSLGFVRVTGDDRVRWLNGMVTNSIQSLTPGQGCYNFFLNAQGRIQGDATAFLAESSILLETGSERIPALLAMLDHFIIMDDVELTGLGPARGLLVAGPKSPAILAQLGLPAGHAQPLGIIHTRFADAPVDLIFAHSPLVPRFELWADAATISALSHSLAADGAVTAAAEAFEHLRLLEGTPRYGVDIRDRDLPQETAQTRALHFAKGCYLGQEIVERIRSRGNVHRTFTGFLLQGSVPPSGTPLFVQDAPDKPVGELTSAASIELPGCQVTLGLGYIRREVLDRGSAIQYAGGTATPATLPFANLND